jgi:uncharacterized membrane protein YgcG
MGASRWLGVVQLFLYLGWFVLRTERGREMNIFKWFSKRKPKAPVPIYIGAGETRRKATAEDYVPYPVARTPAYTPAPFTGKAREVTPLPVYQAADDDGIDTAIAVGLSIQAATEFFSPTPDYSSSSGGSDYSSSSDFSGGGGDSGGGGASGSWD